MDEKQIEKTINKRLYGNYARSYLKIYEIKEINYEWKRTRKI